MLLEKYKNIVKEKKIIGYFTDDLETASYFVDKENSNEAD